MGRWRILITGFLFLVSTTTVLLLQHSSRIGHDQLIGESSLVEQGSAWLWIASALCCFFGAFHRGVNRTERFLLAYLFLVFGGRELDLHRHLLSWNLLHFANYFKSHIPLLERLLALSLLIFPVLFATARLANGRRVIFRSAWRAGEEWARTVTIWFALLFTTFNLDKFNRHLGRIGIHIEYDYPIRAMEETLELSLAAFTFLTVVTFLRSTGASEEMSAPPDRDDSAKTAISPEMTPSAD